MRAASRAGFTMLEVLAAVLIVGVLFSVLSRVASQGLLAEGRNRRWLEASLLADALMIDLETGLATGQLPELGREEEENEYFLVAVEVRAVDARALLPVEGGVDPWLDNPLLGSGDEPSRLREIEVSVSWPEGIEENRITRTTFAVDLSDLQFASADAGGVPDAGGDAPDGAEGATGSGADASSNRGKGGKAGSLEQMLERWERNPNK